MVLYKAQRYIIIQIGLVQYVFSFLPLQFDLNFIYSYINASIFFYQLYVKSQIYLHMNISESESVNKENLYMHPNEFIV